MSCRKWYRLFEGTHRQCYPKIEDIFFDSANRGYMNHSLPRGQRNESLYGYLRRLIVNSVSEVDAMAKVFTVLKEKFDNCRETDFFKHFVVGTLAEALKINAPQCLEMLDVEYSTRDEYDSMLFDIDYRQYV